MNGLTPVSYTHLDVYKRQPPNLILHHQHTDLFQLLAQLLDVIADQPVIDIYVCLLYTSGRIHADFWVVDLSTVNFSEVLMI